MASNAYSPKIALVGDTGVGKTSIMKRYCHGTFKYNISSIGIDQAKKVLTFEDSSLEVSPISFAFIMNFFSRLPSSIG